MPRPDPYTVADLARELCRRSGRNPDDTLLGRPSWEAFVTDAEALMQMRDLGLESAG